MSQFEDTKNEIENWKEEYLSSYCLNGCGTICCDFSKVVLPLTESQIYLLFGDQVSTDDFEINKKGLYELKDRNIICPQYDMETGVCKVHSNPERPQACEKFPLGLTKRGFWFLEGFGVGIDDRCECLADFHFEREQRVRDDYKALVDIIKRNHLDVIFVP